MTTPPMQPPNEYTPGQSNQPPTPPTPPAPPTAPTQAQPTQPFAPAGDYQQTTQFPQQGAYQQQPQYAQPGGQYPAQPPTRKTNTLAIIALISSFFVSVLGIILGHISLSQIKKTGEGGRPLALAATIIGYLVTAIYFIVAIVLIISALSFGKTIIDSATDFENQLQEIEEQITDELPPFGETPESSQDDYDDTDGVADFSDRGEWAQMCNILVNESPADIEGVPGHISVSEYFARAAEATPEGDVKRVLQDLSEIEKIENFTDEQYDEWDALMTELEDRVAELCFD